MKRKALFKSILSILVAFTIMVPGFPSLADEEDTIYIKSSQDLIDMAKDCRLDTYSLEKTFVLSNDISLDGTYFKEIPVFRGTFDGKGHTISGFLVRDSIAPLGLFGIIEPDGVVKNLSLKGKVVPAGDSNAIGGICGINRGLIENCRFEGTVSGKESLGGIAGINEFSGIIRDCTSSGKIAGQRMAGGIAGNNHGLVEGSKNHSLVNMDSLDPTINIDEIESDMQSAIIRDTEVEKIYSAVEDVGGIVGFSDGIITDCVNEGDVGYSHIGYNMGGIAGRNRGFVFASSNKGIINGRREVGGIVGQAEPFISTVPTEDKVISIRSALHSLRDLVDKATRDVDEGALKTSERLTNINDIISKANDNVKDLTDTLSDSLEENLNNNIKEVNRGSEIAKRAFDRLDSIAGKLPDINKKITDALDSLSQGIDEAINAGTNLGAAMDDFSMASDDLTNAINLFKRGESRINTGIQRIRNAFIFDEEHALVDISWDVVIEGCDIVKEGADLLKLGDVESGYLGIYDFLSSAPQHIKDGTGKLRSGVDFANSSMAFLENTTNILEDASTDFTTVLDEVSALTDFLSHNKPIKLSFTRSDARQYSNDLHNNITNLSREIESLNGDTTSFSDILMADIRAINDQFFVVMDLIIDEVEDVKNASLTDKVLDVSDEDINNSTDGKVQLCTNSGKVFGDINAGGIAGSMGIFNDQNPEDDNTSINDALRAKYKLKAILQNCTNYGDITGKKDYVGAVCGVSILGVITDCKGFGSATAEDGDYVGGISGGSSTTIRNSYVKCFVSGKKYVGGVVGLNSTKDNGTGSVTNCVSVIKIPYFEQYSGAICGYDEGIIENNFFFGDYAGINNASYFGKAEPVDFETLISMENIPDEFKRFKVTFVAGEEKIKETWLDYMGAIGKESYPEIPPLEGCFGKWDKNGVTKISFDEFITAEYFPYVTAIAAGTEEEEPSKFIAIGKFSDLSVLEYEKAFENDEQIKSLELPAEFLSKIEPMEAYVVTAEDLKKDNISLRIHVGSENVGSTGIYIEEKGIWKRVATTEVGGYLQFEVPSGTNTVVAANIKNYRFILLIAILVVLAAVIIFTTVRVKRKRAKRQVG